MSKYVMMDCFLSFVYHLSSFAWSWSKYRTFPTRLDRWTWPNLGSTVSLQSFTSRVTWRRKKVFPSRPSWSVGCWCSSRNSGTLIYIHISSSSLFIQTCSNNLIIFIFKFYLGSGENQPTVVSVLVYRFRPSTPLWIDSQTLSATWSKS